MGASIDQFQGDEFGLELAELLDVLVGLGEAPAGILARWDPHDGRRRVAAVRGHPAELVDHLVSGAFQRDGSVPPFDGQGLGPMRDEALPQLISPHRRIEAEPTAPGFGAKDHAESRGITPSVPHAEVRRRPSSCHVPTACICGLPGCLLWRSAIRSLFSTFASR